MGQEWLKEKQKKCGSLGENNCKNVQFCVWNSTNETLEKYEESGIITYGGRCVPDPCLKYNPTGGVLNSWQDCFVDNNDGVYNLQYDSKNCYVLVGLNPSIPGEYWCAQDNEGTLEDCSVTKNCSNRTHPSQAPDVLYKDEICSWNEISDNCFLDSMRNEGFCNTTNQCREFDIEGIKICHSTKGCDAYGADDCIHYPDCMVVDGHCVKDGCFVLSYDEQKDECSDRPEVCTGHKFTQAYFYYTYQSEENSESNKVVPAYPYFYHNYSVKYTYTWKCTNKQYNNNPNPYVDLPGDKGGKMTPVNESTNPITNSVTNRWNYGWQSESTDKCKVARDPKCGWCPEFNPDYSVCTGAGGQWKDLPIKPVCSDDRGKKAAALSLLSPSPFFITVLVVVASMVALF